MDNVFPQTGEAGITVKYSGTLLNSATAIDVSLLQPPQRFYVMFTSGITGLVIGRALTGGTSSATAVISNVVITSGTLATSDATGILFFTNIVGTFTAGENLNTGVTTYAVANTSQIDCKSKGLLAKAIFMTVETNTLRINWTPGQAPTNSAATPANLGHPITNAQNIEIVGYANCKNFQMINAVSGTTGVANITIKF
jgi:hypothetical protein